jgi:hypothetical protein
MHTFTCTHVSLLSRTYTRTHLFPHTHTHIQVHTHTGSHTHALTTRALKHSHTHTCTHAHTQVVRERQEQEAIRKKAKFIALQSSTFWAKAQRVVATKVCAVMSRLPRDFVFCAGFGHHWVRCCFLHAKL